MTQKKKIGIALTTLIALHALVVLAGFFAPYDYVQQDRGLPFAPPTRLHLVDGRGGTHFRPFVYAWSAAPDTFGSYVEDTRRAFPIRFFVTGAPYTIVGVFHSRLHLFGVDEPGRIFLLGSDAFGRDQFSRLIFGGQISLFAGLLATTISLGLGLALGSLAGFYGGWTDRVLVWLVDVFLALPWLYLLFAVRAFLPLRLEASETFFMLTAVIGLVGWAKPARMVRAIVLSAKERNFVLAARGFGASDFYLLRRHILPETYGVLLTQAALLAPLYILAEVTMSFLGLGVGEPTPSWGNMLIDLQKYYVLASYWWMAVPAGVLILVFFLYYSLASGLEARLKPAGI